MGQLESLSQHCRLAGQRDERIRVPEQHPPPRLQGELLLVLASRLCCPRRTTLFAQVRPPAAHRILCAQHASERTTFSPNSPRSDQARGRAGQARECSLALRAGSGQRAARASMSARPRPLLHPHDTLAPAASPPAAATGHSSSRHSMALAHMRSSTRMQLGSSTQQRLPAAAARRSSTIARGRLLQQDAPGTVPWHEKNKVCAGLWLIGSSRSSHACACLATQHNPTWNCH